VFDFAEHGAAQRPKKIDGRLPRSLIELPVAITGDVTDGDLRSLAMRDLERGSGVSLPSGEAVATEFGVEPLTSPERNRGKQIMPCQARPVLLIA
jgi:hypothetical protein